MQRGRRKRSRQSRQCRPRAAQAWKAVETRGDEAEGAEEQYQMGTVDDSGGEKMSSGGRPTGDEMLRGV